LHFEISNTFIEFTAFIEEDDPKYRLFFECSLKVHKSTLIGLLSENFLLRRICGASDPVIEKSKMLLCNVLLTRTHMCV